jgi:hypothetical protein
MKNKYSGSILYSDDGRQTCIVLPVDYFRNSSSNNREHFNKEYFLSYLHSPRRFYHLVISFVHFLKPKFFLIISISFPNLITELHMVKPVDNYLHDQQSIIHVTIIITSRTSTPLFLTLIQRC